MYRLNGGGAALLRILLKLFPSRGFWSEEQGQDFVEYALLTGFMAVAGGAVIPPMAQSIGGIFSKACSVLAKFS